MLFVEWVDQVWEAVSRWRNSIDPETRMELRFTADDLAQQWGSHINTFSFEYFAVMDALDVLRQCHLVELTDEFGSIGSLYALTVSGEDFVGQLISVGARPILDDLDLTEEDSRFLQAAVKLSEENEGAQAKRKALTTRDVFEQLGWLGTGNVPVRTRRLMDRLRTMQLVETTGPGTPLDKDIGPVYDFTPSYKAYLWYAQRSER